MFTFKIFRLRILALELGSTAGIGLILRGDVLLLRAGIINHELKTQRQLTLQISLTITTYGWGVESVAFE